MNKNQLIEQLLKTRFCSCNLGPEHEKLTFFCLDENCTYDKRFSMTCEQCEMMDLHNQTILGKAHKTEMIRITLENIIDQVYQQNPTIQLDVNGDQIQKDIEVMIKQCQTICQKSIQLQEQFKQMIFYIQTLSRRKNNGPQIIELVQQIINNNTNHEKLKLFSKQLSFFLNFKNGKVFVTDAKDNQELNQVLNQINEIIKVLKIKFEEMDLQKIIDIIGLEQINQAQLMNPFSQPPPQSNVTVQTGVSHAVPTQLIYMQNIITSSLNYQKQMQMNKNINPQQNLSNKQFTPSQLPSVPVQISNPQDLNTIEHPDNDLSTKNFIEQQQKFIDSLIPTKKLNIEELFNQAVEVTKPPPSEEQKPIEEDINQKQPENEAISRLASIQEQNPNQLLYSKRIKEKGGLITLKKDGEVKNDIININNQDPNQKPKKFKVMILESKQNQGYVYFKPELVDADEEEKAKQKEADEKEVHQQLIPEEIIDKYINSESSKFQQDLFIVLNRLQQESQNRQYTINLEYHDLQAAGIDRLSKEGLVLLKNVEFLELNLNNNSIEIDGASRLAALALKNLTKLTKLELHLKENNLGNGGVTQLVLQGLRHLVKLQSLRLQLEENDIGPEGIDVLCNQCLKNLINLSTLQLELNSNKINDKGVESLSKLIQVNNPKLTNLRLYLLSNSIGDDGAGYLSQMFKVLEKRLQKLELRLTNNKITNNGLQQLMVQGIKNLQNLTKLEFYLNGNKFGVKGAQNIASALQSNVKLNNLILYLNNNQLEYEGMEKLANSGLNYLKSLQFLVLFVSNNNLDARSADALAKGIRTLIGLKQIEVNFNLNKLNWNGLEIFINNGIKFLTNLEKFELFISNNTVTQQDIKRVRSMISEKVKYCKIHW